MRAINPRFTYLLTLLTYYLAQLWDGRGEFWRELRETMLTKDHHIRLIET